MSADDEWEKLLSQSGESTSDDTTDNETEDVDTLFASWKERTFQLRRIADRTRWLAAQLSPYHGKDTADDLKWVIEEFRDISGSLERADLEGLILDTTRLYHRGTDVLNPERSPNPLPSPFVRHMPKEQAKIEATRYQRQGRHVTAYEFHILQALEHFVQAWTALIDGCLICDWDMIDDEFPKLAVLADEVDRAFTIWSSVTDTE